MDLLFNDWQEIIRNNLGKEPWIVVYFYKSDPNELIGLYSALIPNGMIDEVLKDNSWDLSIGQGFPTYDKISQKYIRFNVKRDGIEPLIFCRNFFGIKETYEEISEEFRHYYNLYHDVKSNKYVIIDDVGDEDDVIMLHKNEIKIKLKYLKKFLSAKKMHMAIYFDLRRYSSKSLQELGMEEYSRIIKEDKYIYSLSVREDDEGKPFSVLLGKRLIEGLRNYEPDYWGSKKYVDFIINIDEESKEIYHKCNPDKLANNFGSNPKAPNYLTPIFFRREVLNKYYSEPEKYSVEDGFLHCKGLWGLSLDNNHLKYVIVYLGDLGDLPTKEQFYWRSFNVPPEGRISSVSYKRQILGQFADPERSDLLFKQRFYYFQKKWFEKFSWYFFKPLEQGDKHFYTSLRIPLTNDQAEFDHQVLALTKIIIDSINEAEIEKVIAKDKEDKSITKLEKYLYNYQLQNFDKHIKFLRNLQDLRDGSVHRKGEKYLRGSNYFQLDKKSLGDAFDNILICAISLLDYLYGKFLIESSH